MVKAPVGGAKHHSLLLPSCSVIALVATCIMPTAAHAAGTLAGTTISNTASASFDNGGGTQTIDSNRVDLKVDELLDVTVAGNATDVPTAPGATNQVLTYRVTNTGNGPEAFALSTIANVGGDNYDPVVTQIFIDANGNGTWDPTDTLYVAGSESPLQPDTAMTLFVLATTPASAVDGNRGIVTLVAAAKTGTGAPGTSFAGKGEGGGDAIVGSTGADGQDNGAYKVSAATVTLVKSAAVVDPFGGSEPVPGATITYTITATIAGLGSVNGLAITDNVPADTAYVVNSIKLGATGLTDATDADAGDYDGTRIRVQLGTVAGGQTRAVTFKTKIK